MQSIQSYLQRLGVDQHVIQKSVEYYDFRHVNRDLIDQNKIVSLFSPQIQNDYNSIFYGDIIKKQPIFKFLSLTEIQWVISQLKTKVYLPDQIIISNGDIGDEIYFILVSQESSL